MKHFSHIKSLKWAILSGLVVGLISMGLTVGLATAAPLPNLPALQPTVSPADTTPPASQGTIQPRCLSCHQEITESWMNSPHAHAYDDPVYQERWSALGNPANCQLCHTTGFQASTGKFEAPGVSCEACHGQVSQNHPLEPVEIRSDAEYCGACHTTTLAEWRLTGHAQADIGCTDCHDAHSQKAVFENPDDMCINCHQDSMGPYLENTHAQKDIGCVDCHALVIPPEVPPVDGIVPTGHTFTITPATCVACHTDALHAGFSLPGYEAGAKAASETITDTTKVTPEATSVHASVNTPEEEIQRLQTQVQTLEAANASRNMTVIFQGGVIGLVLGGSTAWLVANNLRRSRKEEDDEVEDGKEEE